MWPALEAASDTALDQQHRRQATLPAGLGGMQVHPPSAVAGLVRAAAVLQVGPALRQEIATWQQAAGEPVDPAAWDGVGNGAELQATLHSHGLSLGPSGLPLPLGSPSPPDPARPPSPARHLLSAFLRERAKLLHAGLLREFSAARDGRSELRLQCAGGQTSGRSLVAHPGSPGACFKDASWTAAVQWRLGISGQGCQCRNESRSGERCREPVEPLPDHALACPRGPLRNVLHNQLADEVASIVEECGAHARLEAFVKEFTAATGKDAFLDV